MPSRIDEAGHTKAFDDPVAEHWGESQRANRSLVGCEPTSAHTYESEIQRSTTFATPTSPIKSEKMAEALLNGDSYSFWRDVKKFRRKKAYFPSMVDGVVGPKEIAKVFAQKFDDLYNCVSYDSDEMDVLLTTIHKSIDNKCTGTCVHGSHSISAKDVNKAICKLKASKSDGCTRLLADHIINAGDKLCTYLSLLFTAMLRHGSIPDGILLGTMVPIPKGRWTNLNSSENFRAITLSSTFGKLIDLITLEKEGSKLGTSDLQFSFKDGASTSLCTAMVQETASYYVNGGSNVYGLLLDASKAFDRVNYCKLFRTLMNRGVCPLYSRLLLNMYTNQKLRVRWNAEFSDSFAATNGVKQGGVISPVLFCVYMDGLLAELADSGYGCFMSGVFAGAFA